MTRRRLLGWALLIYGLAGIVLLVATAILGFGLATRVERLLTSADETLVAASRSVDSAAAAFANVDASLGEGQASTDAAATLARDASQTLSSLGRAMELSIFGAQPLLPLADDFDRSAEQANALGDTLDAVGGSLDATRTDAGAIGIQLERLATELGELRDATGTDGDAPPIRLILGLVLAWLLVPAIGGLIAGWALLAAPETPEVVTP